MQNVILTNYEAQELQNFITQGVKEAIQILNLFNNHPEKETQKQILTRKETAAILGISLPTLHSLTMQSKIKSFRLGHLIRYRLDDVYASLSQIEVGGAKW